MKKRMRKYSYSFFPFSFLSIPFFAFIPILYLLRTSPLPFFTPPSPKVSKNQANNHTSDKPPSFSPLLLFLCVGNTRTTNFWDLEIGVKTFVQFGDFSPQRKWEKERECERAEENSEREKNIVCFPLLPTYCTFLTKLIVVVLNINICFIGLFFS